MAIHFYHPNKAVKGFACSFWRSQQSPNLFITLIKQSGWDEVNQNGIFKGNLNDPTKKVNVKLSDIEAAGILDCIERNRPFSSFHTGFNADDATKAISFTPWMTTVVADEGEARPAPMQKGFSLSVTVTPKGTTEKNSFYIGLAFAEARLIREFIVHHLHTSFSTHSLPVATLEATETPEPSNNSPSQPSKSLVDI